ncbi:hypothetical protein CH333_00880 [candidate division WOR-3 bacterium JGI_Cruoil_03_44_89]|uniref:DUF4412 domain-containing protein n=1 Tax=candidate division WOR-3 bacterium JGI_Cruoil_03_44_89 TaxID=1973748 RepID=A0A235C097_UNCW3|nr:MAG: hypothetical protein CH333_00880 [candidate division WOR-3 bacterium JGI_Cruoil_03_44_89]
MQKKTAFGWLVGMAALVVCSIPAFAAQFTADINEHDGEQIKSGKIYVKDSKYRMELEEDGQQIVIIVDQDAGVTRVVVPDEKMYVEMEADDPMSLMNDPFQSLKYTVSIGESKPLGTETVNGYECSKYVISMQGQDVMTRWVSQKLEFPIKIVNHVKQNKFMELTNIQEGSVDDSLFQVPSGYTKWEEPGEKPIDVPDWAKEVPSAPVMKPPFERDMPTGEMIRVRVEPSKSIWVKGKSKTEAGAMAKAIPFLDGKPIKDPSMYNNFAAGGVICARLHETPREANEVVIRISEGEVAVTAKYYEMVERSVSAGEELWYLVEGHDAIETRFVNLDSGVSICTRNYFKEGKQLSDDVVGPAKYRTVTLESKNEIYRCALSADADEIVFRVEKGAMLIKLGQYDSFKF